MGLLTSVNNISYEMQEQKKQKEAEKMQQKKDKIKKQELREYKKELEKRLLFEFQQYFDVAGTSYVYEFYNKERKQKILNDFFNTIKIEKKDILEFYHVPYKKELEQHFFDNYNKLLKKAYKEQEQQEQYNLITEAEKIQEKQKKEIEQKEKDEKTTKVIIAICLIPLAFIFFPLIFVIAILLGAVKKQ